MLYIKVLILSLFSFILADQFETPNSSTGKSDLTFEQTTNDLENIINTIVSTDDQNTTSEDFHVSNHASETQQVTTPSPPPPKKKQ